MTIVPTREEFTAAAPRFWAKVERGDGCWIWTAGRDSWGYGLLRVGRVVCRAHVVAWALTHGRWPDRDAFPKEIIRHSCDTPWCVRPDHLLIGTYRDNMRDRRERGRNRRVLWPALRAERLQGGRTHG